MKARVFFAVAAMVLLAGCNKEIGVEIIPAPQKTTIEVGLPSGTKTYLGPEVENVRRVYWSNGDKIAVNGIASAKLSGLAADTDKAVFSFASNPETPYKIAYPASIWTDATHVTISGRQDYRADGFADGVNPMAGYSEDGTGTITLHHLCAVVKISIKRATTAADEDDIVGVRFKGRNNEQVKGLFAIDYTASPIELAGASDSDADKEVGVAKTQTTSTTEAVEYYLVIPAGTYSSGFDIIVKDAQGDIMTKSKTTSWTAVAGKQYNMTEFVFNPNGTDPGVEISSAEDLVQFAIDYNAGKYEAYGSTLNVTLAADIDFDATSSAAFNATGGIGTGDSGNGVTNHFNGVFDGNNKAITGLEATVPVFNYTGSNSTIKNLTLESTCSYTINSPATEAFHGALVGRNKGSITGCASDAPVIINNIQDVNTAIQNYGGLVGINYGGTIDGCVVTGNITCSQTGQTITANEVRFGGIAGYQDGTGSTIVDCSFSGNITISDATTYGGITASGRYFYVGGILGRAEKGAVSGCAAGIDGTPRAIDVRGTFVPGIGGIIGWGVTAEGCKVTGSDNYMSISFSTNGARANTTPTRVGGVAGRSADISNCTNNAAISSVSNSTTVYLGGIAADGVNISDCTNNAGGTITRSNAEAAVGQTNRYVYMGGIMGAPSAAGDIKNCTNHGAVTSNILGTASGTTVDIGGILGAAGSQVDIESCTNDAEVKLNNDNASAAAVARIALGGILGNVTAANTTVKDCGNGGKVWCNNNTAGSYGPMYIGGTIGHTDAACTVTDCTNSGVILCQNPGAAISAYVDLGGIVGSAEATITITGTAADKTINSGTVTVSQASSAILYARNTEGGILGYGKGNNTKIANCKNTAEIKCDLSGATASGRPAYTGGIVGLIAAMTYSSNAASGLGSVSGVEIDSCNNTGKVTSSNYSNSAGNKNSAFAGGIIGLISGKSGSKANIHDCTVGTQNVYVYRGVGGGVIGYANLCTLKDNTSSVNMSGMNTNVNGVGGIVGRMFDSSMEGCTFSGKIAKAKKIGGLVYTLSDQTTGSTITGCKVNGATLTSGTADDKTAAAVLVSVTDAKANTITNCGVKGTLDGAAITLESNMITTNGGATVTGTYLIP